MDESQALQALTPHEAFTLASVFERMFPADINGPGAKKIGAHFYVDRALAGAYQDQLPAYRLGMQALDRAALALFASPFVYCTPGQQDALLGYLEQCRLPFFHTPPQKTFFTMLLNHLREGLFADPAYGGNRDKWGWRIIGHPGVWLENSAAENMSPEPVTKGGVIQSLADLGYTFGRNLPFPPNIPGDDPQAGARPPDGPVDVVLVGLGAAGSMAALVLAKAGLKVLALEAGPWRKQDEFVPDELRVTTYGRASMGQIKFNKEIPTWRPNPEEPAVKAPASLGLMVNGVGGSILHYGAWLRRYHPHHFKSLTRILTRWGKQAIPPGCTISDWPISYEDLEPYYNEVEYIVGVSGDSTANPFIPRSAPYPMPPLRPFRWGELVRQATSKMGLHPYPGPAGLNSVPYGGRPATTYTAWSLGFGPIDPARWHPDTTVVPAAFATGNFEVRAQCRVIRILTNAEGRAIGVEYVDTNRQRRTQMAGTVILCSYTWENIRLLLLSGDEHHPYGLGNNTGQVGRNIMTKMYNDVRGFFPDQVFNLHTGPGAQSIVIDDFLADDFDSFAHGFIGGGTLSVENQALPLQISREPLPIGVPSWGSAYKAHLRQWNHWGSLRIQPDSLPYLSNYVDLDPYHRDLSGLGLPVVRITYDLQANEQRLVEWMEAKRVEILRALGASTIWKGKRFTGVLSAHDLGGCRMGEDPAYSVVNSNLQVHDTPGLYVFSGATFPSCPGINPTLTLWAVCMRAADRLVEHLRRS